MNQLFPSEPGHPSWPLRLSKVYEHFGLQERSYKLPLESLPTVLIQGVPVWVEQAPNYQQRLDALYASKYGQAVLPIKIKKSSTHRVKAACPECGFICSLGRLAQHAKIHSPNRAKKA